MSGLLPLKVNKIPITTLKVTYGGDFDLKELYKLVHEWLKDNNWKDVQSGKDDQHEVLYHERSGASGVRDMWIWWRLQKLSSNSYYKYTLNVDYLVIGMGKNQIVHKGRKVKCDNGELNIDISVTMHLDYKGQWSKNWLLRYFMNVFPQRIFKGDIDNHFMEGYYEAYDLQGTIKKYLHLKGFLAQMEVEPFFESKEYSIGGQ